MIIGFVSDIHEDIKNLERALRLLDSLKVDEIVCLGDIVGFNVASCNFIQERNATACVFSIKKHCSKVIPGNHDLYAVRNTPEYRGGFDYEDNWYNMDFETRKSKGKDKIWLYEETELANLMSMPEKAYIDSLPETDYILAGDIKLLFTHYIYPNISGSAVGFVESKRDFDAHLDWMKVQHSDISFSGHGHIEGLQIGTRHALKKFGFGKTVKIEPGTMIIGPCIARGSKTNGVMVFNTKTMEVATFPLELDKTQ